MLRPSSFEIQKQDYEIEAAQWMRAEDYAAQPFNQKNENFKNMAGICLTKLQKDYTRFSTMSSTTSSGIPLNRVYRDGSGPSYADVVKASRNGFGSTDSLGVQRMMQVPCNDSCPTNSQGLFDRTIISSFHYLGDKNVLWSNLVRARVLILIPLSHNCPVSIKVDAGGDSFIVSVLEDTVPVSNSKILQWLGLDKMELDGVSNFESKNKKVSQGGGVEPIKAIVTMTRKAVTFQNSSRSLTVDRVVESPNVTRIEEGVIDAGGKVI
ncbi:hypothetical protein QYF36_009055 [Acer negundo]|nr:hypothetical protein QYF36_009055 [Acer negundo]